MPSWVPGAVGTFAISAAFAYVFLRLRCRGVGYPLGPRARPWAIGIILITAVMSTGLGVAAATASGRLGAYIGVIVPSGLWLGKASARWRRQRSIILPGTLISRLTLPLRRLDDRMGDDVQDWCDARSRAASANPQLISDAAEHYYVQVASLLKDDRERKALNYLRGSIEHKVRTARLASLNTTQARLRAALDSHPSTRNSRRYSSGDPACLARRLMSDAESELNLLLAHIYRLGHRKLVIYMGFKPSAAPGKKVQDATQRTVAPS